MSDSNNPCDVFGANRQDDGSCLDCMWNAVPNSEWEYQDFFEEWLENFEVTWASNADMDLSILDAGDLDAGILEPTSADESTTQDEAKNEVNFTDGAGNLPSPALTLPTIDKDQHDGHQLDNHQPWGEPASWDEIVEAFGGTPVSQVVQDCDYPRASGHEYGSLQTGPGLRPAATTNPARNHVLQDHGAGMNHQNFIGDHRQFNVNTGILNQASDSFQDHQFTFHDPNNAQLGPSPFPFASQTHRQVPQDFLNPQLSTTWLAHNYALPMPTFNPGTTPYHFTQGPLANSQPAQQPLGHGTFFIAHDLPYIAPGQGFLDDPIISQLAPAPPPAPRGTPVPPFQPLNLPQRLPVPSQEQKYGDEQEEGGEQDEQDAALLPTKRQHPNPNNPNPNTTPGKGTGNTRLGKRGRQNAHLHAKGLCIWCKQANPDLRHKGCPKCLPERAARTAKWRREKARRGAGEQVGEGVGGGGE